MKNTIYLIDDEASIQKLVGHWARNLWKYEFKAFTTGKEFLEGFNRAQPDLVLLDIMLPDTDGLELLKKIKSANPELPVIMLSAQGNVDVAIESLHLGAFDYISKPIEHEKLGKSIKNAITNYNLNNQIKQLKQSLKDKYSFENIISTDRKMQEVFELVSRVLNNDITVLIHGESGTGKELIARAIHFNGNRKENPFVIVNCASIPHELLESELFGHEKGAFTGAHQRKIGKFELADGGTIFLDEVGDLQMSLQAKILRVIQEKEFERVGGNELIKTDVRIISATNKDLKKAVIENKFREDLYYRLNSFPIYLPPLRERKNDIIVLAEHFIALANKKLNKSVKGLSRRALRLFYDYDWPGNVRELENTIERCVILTDKELIDVDVLPPQIKSGDLSMLPGVEDIFSENSPIIPFEKLKEQAIKHALEVTNNNIVEAAKKLKIGRATLYRLMEKYNIKKV